jgi:hypothetical protein
MDLCLAGRFISRESVKGARPLLARLYTRKFDTIVTYLGAGRANEGLGLHRLGPKKPFTPSYDNAWLAIKKLRALGHTDEAIAKHAGFASFTGLDEAIDGLKDHAAFLAPLPSSSPAPRDPVPNRSASANNAERHRPLAQVVAEVPAKIAAGEESPNVEETP